MSLISIENIQSDSHGINKSELWIRSGYSPKDLRDHKKHIPMKTIKDIKNAPHTGRTKSLNFMQHYEIIYDIII